MTEITYDLYLDPVAFKTGGAHFVYIVRLFGENRRCVCVKPCDLHHARNSIDAVASCSFSLGIHSLIPLCRPNLRTCNRIN